MMASGWCIRWTSRATWTARGPGFVSIMIPLLDEGCDWSFGSARSRCGSVWQLPLAVRPVSRRVTGIALLVVAVPSPAVVRLAKVVAGDLDEGPAVPALESLPATDLDGTPAPVSRVVATALFRRMALPGRASPALTGVARTVLAGPGVLSPLPEKVDIPALRFVGTPAWSWRPVLPVTGNWPHRGNGRNRSS